MTDSQPPLPLAAEFPVASSEQWQALASKALRGKPVSELRQVTTDGLVIDPLYARAVNLKNTLGQFPYTRSTEQSNAAWEIRQEYALPQPASCNRQILHELERGVNGIHLRLSSAAVQQGCETMSAGVHISNAADMTATLNGVLPSMVNISLDAGCVSNDAAHWLLEWLQTSADAGNNNSAQLNAVLGKDPLAYLAATGQLPAGKEQALHEMTELVAQTTQHNNVRAIAIDTSVYHNAGASNVQELALMLATGKQYLQAMLDQGIDIDVACQQIECRLSVDADFFIMAAKLRSARTLWATLCRTCGATDKASTLKLHCSTSQRMLAKPDPWVNMLRTTVACAGAAIGGADSISVESFDALETATGTDKNDLGRRVARNSQIVLQEESGLHRVADPLGGSGYVEHLTKELSRLGWNEFRAIEVEGGMWNALGSGYVQKQVENSWGALLSNVRVRKQGIVGVSEFADTEEAMQSESTATIRTAATSIALPLRRLSEPFERIRQQVEKTDSLTPVFTAVIGTPAEYLPRVQFSRNLLAAGGFSMSAADGEHSVESMQAGVREHANKTVVFCASAATPEEQVSAALLALLDAGATNVFVASSPPEQSTGNDQVPASHYLYLGCDAVELLTQVATAHGLELP